MKPKTREPRIDVHHHLFPAFYVKILKELDMARSGGIRLPEWTPQKALAYMDQACITTGVLSITSPGVHFGDDGLSRYLSRKCNEYMASLARDYPLSWGGFATLPLPDVNGALQEVDYALGTLQLHGVGLMSNVGGHYLGNPNYEELWQELDQMNAVVFIHPNDPPGSEMIPHLIPATEWPIDTSRTAASLLFSGILQKYPRIRFILSHAGGVLPVLAEWLGRGVECRSERFINDERIPGDTEEDLDWFGNLNLLQKLYFDTCQSQNLWTLLVLLEFTDPSHILFGTDFGMSFVSRITNLVIKSGLTRYRKLFSPEELKGIYSGNALGLFPTLQNQKQLMD